MIMIVMMRQVTVSGMTLLTGRMVHDEWSRPLLEMTPRQYMVKYHCVTQYMVKYHSVKQYMVKDCTVIHYMVKHHIVTYHTVIQPHCNTTTVKHTTQ